MCYVHQSIKLIVLLCSYLISLPKPVFSLHIDAYLQPSNKTQTDKVCSTPIWFINTVLGIVSSKGTF